MITKEFLFVDDEGNYTEELVEGSYVVRICDSSAAIGDLVMESLTLTYGVDTSTNNTNKRSVFGIIIEKRDTTTAVVMTKGVISGLLGLDKSLKVYLSEGGNFTDELPVSEYMQVLGHAIDFNAMDFNPAATRVKRVFTMVPANQDEIIQNIPGINTQNYMGYTVSVSNDGTVLASGHYGSVSICRKVGGTWELEKFIAGTDAGHMSQISGDGSTVVFGEKSNDPGGVSNAGEAYVYWYNGVEWVLQATLTDLVPAANDYFGTSVAISDDGNQIVVGSPRAANGSYSDKGKAIIYRRSGSVWNQVDVIESTYMNSIRFGNSIAFSGDGNYIAVGANYDHEYGVFKGAVYIFKDTGGDNWVEASKMTTSDNVRDQVGTDIWSLKMNVDGTVFVLGVIMATYNDGDNRGKSYVFKRSGSIWSEDVILVKPNREDNDYFGISVDISDDGNKVIVGTRVGTYDTENSGEAYLYTYTGSEWKLKKTLITDSVRAHQLGTAVCITSDGTKTLVGDWQTETDSGYGKGAIYFYNT